MRSALTSTSSLPASDAAPSMSTSAPWSPARAHTFDLALHAEAHHPTTEAHDAIEARHLRIVRALDNDRWRARALHKAVEDGALVRVAVPGVGRRALDQLAQLGGRQVDRPRDACGRRRLRRPRPRHLALAGDRARARRLRDDAVGRRRGEDLARQQPLVRRVHRLRELERKGARPDAEPDRRRRRKVLEVDSQLLGRHGAERAPARLRRLPSARRGAFAAGGVRRAAGARQAVPLLWTVAHLRPPGRGLAVGAAAVRRRRAAWCRCPPPTPSVSRSAGPSSRARTARPPPARGGAIHEARGAPAIGPSVPPGTRDELSHQPHPLVHAVRVLRIRHRQVRSRRRR